jgi:hypothetical protein
MPELTPEILFDVRLVERHIRQGLTTREAYEKHVAALNDIASEADVLDLDALAQQQPLSSQRPS